MSPGDSFPRELTAVPEGRWADFPRWVWGLVGALLLALVLKVGLLAYGAFPFNADEAVVGLMARHILAGERPIFFYGQAYLGSLDAWLIAAGFALAGAKVWVIRAVQVGLYLLTMWTSYLLAWRVTRSRKAAGAAVVLLAVPPVGVTLYTTVSLGGYGEALVLGNLILLTSLALWERPRARGLAVAWGFLSGFGLWVFGLTLVYSLATLPVIVVGLARRGDRQTRWAGPVLVLTGAIIGAVPWLAWAVLHGPQALLSELGGSAIAGASPVGWLTALASHGVNLVLFGPTVMMGLRPPWSAASLALPLAPLALLFWLGTLGFALLRRFRLGDDRAGGRVVAGVAVVLLVGFVITPFGADPSGRYFLPMAVVMAVFGGAWVAHLWRSRGTRWALAALIAVALFNLVSTVQAASDRKVGITTAFDPVAQIDASYLPQLAGFLEQEGETRGYTNYWVAYPLAFVSGEQLVFIPRLPYHQDFRYTARDDRYPPYDALVAGSSHVAYITTHLPKLDEAIAGALSGHGVDYRERVIGPYHVFYALTRPVMLTNDDLAPSSDGP
jgi:4-amino-4-deoxy-L-arabinose transferase-like glycosyltransferase